MNLEVYKFNEYTNLLKPNKDHKVMLIGLVGKPNIGKSTFFRAATLASAETGNYPFVTIKPNFGKAYVKVKEGSAEFDKSDNPREGYTKEGWRFVPVDLMDVAGLVPGASEGQGMGNAFLDDLRQADLLIHVIDASGSTNDKGEPVDRGSYDPANDIKFLETELDLWYTSIINKGWQRFARGLQAQHMDVTVALANQLSGLKVNEDMVKTAVKSLDLNPEAPGTWSEEDISKLATELRKASKPMIIAANKIDVEGAAENVERLQKDFPDYMIVGTSAESEVALREAARHDMIDYLPGANTFKELKELSEQQKNALQFIQKTVLDKFGTTGIQKILDAAVFDYLKYIAVFPGGSKLEDKDGNTLPDCFLMPEGTTALDFAFRLHTDFGNNFIKAVDIRTKMPVGKDHPLKHRDIIEIMAK